MPRYNKEDVTCVGLEMELFKDSFDGTVLSNCPEGQKKNPQSRHQVISFETQGKRKDKVEGGEDQQQEARQHV